MAPQIIEEIKKHVVDADAIKMFRPQESAGGNFENNPLSQSRQWLSLASSDRFHCDARCRAKSPLLHAAFDNFPGGIKDLGVVGGEDILNPENFPQKGVERMPDP
eukprot:CAMPEP_0181397064 /NCGR_PEP_ID=MMETSP1110-20121109/266_1 /TAXON_ID=174948 /ORGANISM="Symbiodinium sp., Strain CCMP421" /LENGTH=104 /DNA_ID=CAMNT_0023518839 /DNA_START=640 /DNA_END=954 /DNA_ORIENTATION=-